MKSSIFYRGLYQKVPFEREAYLLKSQYEGYFCSEQKIRPKYMAVLYNMIYV